MLTFKAQSKSEADIVLQQGSDMLTILFSEKLFAYYRPLTTLPKPYLHQQSLLLHSSFPYANLYHLALSVNFSADDILK